MIAVMFHFTNLALPVCKIRAIGHNPMPIHSRGKSEHLFWKQFRKMVAGNARLE